MSLCTHHSWKPPTPDDGNLTCPSRACLRRHVHGVIARAWRERALYTLRVSLRELGFSRCRPIHQTAGLYGSQPAIIGIRVACISHMGPA